MSNTTTGRIPLWFVVGTEGLAALGLLAILFYGSYTGLSDHHFNPNPSMLQNKNATAQTIGRGLNSPFGLNLSLIQSMKAFAQLFLCGRECFFKILL